MTRLLTAISTHHKHTLVCLLVIHSASVLNQFHSTPSYNQYKQFTQLITLYFIYTGLYEHKNKKTPDARIRYSAVPYFIPIPVTFILIFILIPVHYSY